MPGIAGLVTRMPREWAMRKLLRMVAALRLDPEYATGAWTDESLGIYVGWVIRPGSFCDGMPIQNGSGQVVVVFHGEEFDGPPKTVTPCPQPSGPAARAWYLAPLYEQDPTSFPAALNGRFHGVVTDRS